MPYPGSTKSVGGPIGFAGKTKAGPRRVFLPLSAFFLQMQGDMESDGGEPDGMTGYRKKKKGKKGEKGSKKGDTENRKSVDRTVAGSGAGEDSIGGDTRDTRATSTSKTEAAGDLGLNWKKHPPLPGKPFETTGYESDSVLGKVEILKKKKGRGFTWILKVKAKEIVLGRKASLDHVEGALLKLYQRESMVEGKGKFGFFDKPHKCHWCKGQATKALGWAGHRAVIPTCDSHEKKTRHQIVVVNSDEVSRVRDLPSVQTSAQREEHRGFPFIAHEAIVPIGYDDAEDDEQTEMTTSGGAGGGATHASTGATSTGNIATTPIPIGTPLRRVTPVGRSKKKKSKKKRQAWGDSLVAMAESSG